MEKKPLDSVSISLLMLILDSLIWRSNGSLEAFCCRGHFISAIASPMTQGWNRWTRFFICVYTGRNWIKIQLVTWRNFFIRSKSKRQTRQNKTNTTHGWSILRLWEIQWHHLCTRGFADEWNQPIDARASDAIRPSFLFFFSFRSLCRFTILSFVVRTRSIN